MLSQETLSVILILVVVAVGGYSLYLQYRQGKAITLPSVVATLEGAVPLSEELLKVATIAVQSAEQLKREGKIDSNDVAFNYALDFVKDWFPNAHDVSNEKIIAAINSAVLVASYLSNQIEASKSEVESLQE